MKKAVMLAALFAVLGTTGCYTSRHLAGDDLTAGVFNPYLWITVPIDTVMSPYQITKWSQDESDDWAPWSADQVRNEYDLHTPYWDSVRRNKHSR